MKSNISKGALTLVASGIVCKILGAFFRLPLSYILGVEGLGLYQIVMSVFSFAVIIVSGGLSTTLAKLIADERAKGNFKKIRGYLIIALFYAVISSFVLGLLFFFFARPMSIFQKANDCAVLYKLFFPLLLFSSLVTLYRGVFQGYENMTPTAVSQILEQVCKFVFGLTLAYVLSQRSLMLGLIGAILGILGGEVLAFCYLILKKKSVVRKTRQTEFARREFFGYFFPATLGLIVPAFVHFFDSIVITNRLGVAGIGGDTAISLFGLQTGIVGAVLNFPLIISLSLATAILPNLAHEKNDVIRKQKISKSFSVLWFTLLPVVLGIVAISLPLYKVVYPFLSKEFCVIASRLTAIGGISTILLAVQQFLISVLQAKGEFRFVFMSLAVGGGVKILCTIFLCSIRTINIFGLAIGNVASGLTVLIILLAKAKHSISLGLDSVFVPLLASLSMLAICSLMQSVLPLSNISLLALTTFVGVGIYVLLTFPIIRRLFFEYFGKKRVKRKKSEQNGID